MKPGEIIIKDINVLTGLFERRFDSLLVQIILYIAKNYGLRMSESHRKKLHRNDLHGTQPVRAIDLSHWVYDSDTAAKLSNEINNTWIYDPDRPEKLVSLVHNAGTGIHFHIQVHPNTRRR